MEAGYGWATGMGVHFTREHPFQLVEEEEVPFLLADGRFRLAEKEELMKFYDIDSIDLEEMR